MVKAYPTTTHNLELSDREANLLAGFLWEALSKVSSLNDSATPMIQVADSAMQALFASCGHDLKKYAGTNLLKVKS